MKERWLVLVAMVLSLSAQAHVGTHPSVHDTVAGVIERLGQTMAAEDLVALTPDQAEAVLTDEEREILSTEHLVFRVNVPVTVTVFRDVTQEEVPFWFEERGFEKGEGTVKVDKETFEPWSRDFDAGEIGLGVNSLSGSGDHYFVSLETGAGGEELDITDIYPGQHTVGSLEVGAKVFAGSSDEVREMPERFRGQTLLRGDQGRRREAQLTHIFMMTDYPSTTKPTDIVLTWSDDPQTTQTIQWRTTTEVDDGAVRYRGPGASAWTTVDAVTEELENVTLVNDPVCNRHTVVIRGLEPGATYAYSVRDGESWTEPAEFTTAPDEAVPFKFVYMGDAQNGLDTWGELVRGAFDRQPEVAFYVMAGDLVNRGNQREEWDSFFHNARNVYDRRQLVPCIGNHECQGELGPWMYLDIFTLPENGPDTIPKERAYSFEYSNALFVVLDSNLAPADQTAWLEEQLANTDATWKFVVYHHPAYSSGVGRNNPEVRALWGALFDKYHVDVALQGHDHAYLRTYPMHEGTRVDSPAEGTVYIVSNSGTKYYDQGDFDYTEFGMTNVSTYQVLDLVIEGDTMTYKAYDHEGTVRDEFVIEK